MGILDFLFGRTPRDTDPAPEITITIALRDSHAWTPDLETPAVLTEETAALDHAEPSPRKPFAGANAWAGKAKIATEPLFCMIDYTDASGARSRRRITIRQIVSDPQNVWLSAYCHERAAPRKFRLDRIRQFITQDGEVFDPQAFLNLMCGFVPNAAQTDPGKDHRKHVAKSFNDRIRPALTVLVAASRSDDHVHNEEIDAIMLYAERAAHRLVKAGRIPEMPDLAVFDALPERIDRIRPVHDDVARAMLRIFEWDQDRFDRFGKAIHHVIHADGVITTGEHAFLADLEFLYRDRWTKFAPELSDIVAGSRIFLGMED